jgi:hypothetical protein
MSEVGQVLNESPQIAITAPADGTHYYFPPQMIRIEAQASDADGSVVKVEFFADGVKIGEDIDSSDGWAMDWTDYPLGTTRYVGSDRQLIARATDDDAAVTDSTAVRVGYSESRPR